MMISTPTFCAAYARKVPADQFASLRVAVVGAERLRDTVAHAFREKYGIELLEGYGCTEMAPVVSVNLPDVAGVSQRGRKAGTVGHPLPGVAVRAVDPDTGEVLPCGEEGLLLVKGPNRMKGYLHNDEATRAALRDGWYVTGDIGSIDDDGFVRITDRLARFSKIAGEMVPHLRIEEALSAILDDQNCVVVAVPDESKGEKLVAFYTRQDVEPGDLWKRLGETDLPKLWIPRREHLRKIDAVPLLGTGKVDLRGLKQRALELEAALVAQE
jgi:acyl-[acyl-carrier-protein]-phospholipid O-acyltransferase/long-chain-fatty-acid--[acyl-carrier-protein] ligase